MVFQAMISPFLLGRKKIKWNLQEHKISLKLVHSLAFETIFHILLNQLCISGAFIAYHRGI